MSVAIQLIIQMYT